MNILVINCGSSSLKADVIQSQTGMRLVSLRAERISGKAHITIQGSSVEIFPEENGHESILNLTFPLIIKELENVQVNGIGHRVVHGGEKYNDPVIIDEAVELTIEELSPLVPLHNPINLLGIKIAKKHFPNIPHIAVFDTAFHQTLPKRSRHYALPKALVEKHSIRRYGFHGTSHAYVAAKAAEFLKTDEASLRIITLHLGSGCSAAAVEYGRSVETSMGMTALEGLVMGTRTGDLDPGIAMMLAAKENLSASELDRLFNEESGLKGMSGAGNDMREIIEKAAEGDEDCRLAIQVFSHRIRKYIGAYAAVMGGLDVIVFTGGIGENSAVIRSRCCQRLDFLGASLDPDKNRDIQLSAEDPVASFSSEYSRVKLLAVATDEQYEIARQSAKLLNSLDQINPIPDIPIAISARHAHLTQETVELLFGKGHQLTSYKALSQPGQFAANEKVTLVGPKNKIEHVRILGPTRSKNQIEISRTDEFHLGIDAPVRESGKTENTPGITLIGPEGKVILENGLICALRHIHMTPEDAEIFGVVDRNIVEVEVTNNERSLTFGDVLIRVSPKYKLEMHIDTDEGNAAEIETGMNGSLVATGAKGTLRKKGIKKADPS